VVSIPSGRSEAQTDKLTMREKRCGREFSGSTGVRTEVKVAELLVMYLGSIELACIRRLLKCGV